MISHSSNWIFAHKFSSNKRKFQLGFSGVFSLFCVWCSLVETYLLYSFKRRVRILVSFSSISFLVTFFSDLAFEQMNIRKQILKHKISKRKFQLGFSGVFLFFLRLVLISRDLFIVQLKKKGKKIVFISSISFSYIFSDFAF